MKPHFLIVVVLVSASLSFGQTPSASPTPLQSASPQKTRAKSFGSSLEKYKRKGQGNSPNKQNSDELNDGDTIRVTTDLVMNDVLVKDQNGKLVTDLKKDDFVVKEDGAPQTIEVFSLGENSTAPRSIVLIIDCAGPQFPYLKNSIQAAKLLVDKLAAQDKMAIVTVDVKLRVDFTANKTLLKKTLNSLEKGDLKLWGGLEFEALLAVLNEMFTAEDRQRIIIFQGDGSESFRLNTENDSRIRIHNLIPEKFRRGGPPEEKNFGFGEIKDAVERSRATIYSIIPGIKFLGFSKDEQLARGRIAIANEIRAWGWPENPTVEKALQPFLAELLTVGQTAMFRLAELSGGQAAFVEKPEDAEGVYADVFKVISNRYLVGYYPTNRQADGKRRSVTIEVRGHPEYVVTGRKAYFSE